ncbi:MAG: carbon-nitrogen hydrolase family protein, partial [Armatimonadota bacterium]
EWEFASPRAEIEPGHGLDDGITRDDAPSLSAWGDGNDACFGRWYQVVEGIRPGGMHRFGVYLRTENVLRLWENVVVRLHWRDDEGREVGKTYIHEHDAEGDWYRIAGTRRAPEGAVVLEVQLFFRWSAEGRVWWASPTLTEAAAIEARPVTLATVRFKPAGPTTPEANLAAFGGLVDEAAAKSADIVCLPEYVTSIGGVVLDEAAAPIPGAHTEALGEIARRNETYIVAAMAERDGRAIHNTAVLMDRAGELVGTYRKTHLAFNEALAGVRQGDGPYGVFDTDFGRVGIAICYDNLFTEVVRCLALDGAEIVLLPFWDDARDGDSCYRVTARARCIDNGVYLVTAAYDGPSLIIDALGHVVADSGDEEGVLTADIDLAEAPESCPWLESNCGGTWRTRLAVERRAGAYARMQTY